MSLHLSIYERTVALTAIFAVSFVSFGLATRYVHQGFVDLTLGVPLVCGLLMTLTKCPRCRWPIFKKRTRLGAVWGGSIPEACQQCGLSFTYANR